MEQILCQSLLRGNKTSYHRILSHGNALNSIVPQLRIRYGFIVIQERNSRASRKRHQLMNKIRRDFIIEKNNTKKLSLFESPFMEPSKKTCITVDVLGTETHPPAITEWRKQQIVQKARRTLPLPMSLTGFGDGEMPRFWRHRMHKMLHKMRKMQQMEETPLYEKVSPSVRLFLENLPKDLSHEYSKLYEAYIHSKQLVLSNKIEEIKNKLIVKPLQFPYQLTNYIKGKNNLSKSDDDDDNESEVKEVPRFASGLKDTEYENFLKHHDVMQYLATSLKGINAEEYEAEIEGWRNQFWQRNYGTADPKIPSSEVPCSGCGAFLHCNDPGIPGFMPSEKFKVLNEKQLHEEQCQRCQFLHHFNVSLNVSVAPDEYPKLIAKIHNNRALVVIMVDLLDFPCSIWPGIINLIGEKKRIHIVGNKVDLLPKDDAMYLERIKESLRKSLYVTGVKENVHLLNISLISAKTGYGVENLVSKLMKDHRNGEDIYLIGCTNVGKSTLFNALLQSDLCKLRDCDLINRATTSIWPGTTLNLIKFPIRKPTGWEMAMRLFRLRMQEKNDIAERRLKWTLYRQTKNVQHATLSGRIGMSFRSNVPFSVQSGHPFAKKPLEPKPFDPNHHYFRNCNFFHDTPGTIYKDQILTLLTTEELLKTVPREIITPRTFTLRPLQSLFIGGLARIDLAHARQQVWFTVFASHYLPVHIVYTQQAKHFYETYIGTDMLGVPIGGPERIRHWPLFVPKEITLKGINWTQSCADIVLSTAGWVAITLGPDSQCVLKAFTPEGRGIYVRDPPLLPYAFKLRGKRIEGTPCYENKLFTVDDLVGNAVPRGFFKEEEKHIRQHRFDSIL